jgi:hypothetical protein
MALLSLLFRFGPLWFGLAFLAPLIATAITRWSIAVPLAASPLVVGFLLGGVLGGIATWRRSWL